MFIIFPLRFFMNHIGIFAVRSEDREMSCSSSVLIVEKFCKAITMYPRGICCEIL